MHISSSPPDTVAVRREEGRLFFTDFCEIPELYHVSGSNNYTSLYSITPQGHKTPVYKVTGFYWWVKEAVAASHLLLNLLMILGIS